MVVYIVRHAVAVERGSASYPNDDRPLTDDGRDKMAKAAKAIAKQVGHIDRFISSPLIRAHETAKIVARAFGDEKSVELCDELAPGKSLRSLLTALSAYKALNSILIVGHQPDLGYLASALLGSTESIIEFKKGAVCAIELSTLPPKGSGTLLWHLQPKQLRALV